MSLHQLDFFAAAPAVPGLALMEDFATPDEEAHLSAQIDAAGLAPFKFQGWEGKRLTASFGYAYDFERGRVLAAPPIPDWLLPLRQRIAEWAGVPVDALVQALLIRYDPGAQIGWHRDRRSSARCSGSRSARRCRFACADAPPRLRAPHGDLAAALALSAIGRSAARVGALDRPAGDDPPVDHLPNAGLSR
jgi:hypothetical protein